MTINKNTPEGQKLTKLIRSKSQTRIDNFIAKIVCTKYPIHKLRKKLEEQNRRHFELGRKIAKREIRDVLGIENGL